MVGLITGFSIIIVMCIVALIINSKRDSSIIDNFACEYQKMLEQGLVPRRSRRFQRASDSQDTVQAPPDQNAVSPDQPQVLSEQFSS